MNTNEQRKILDRIGLLLNLKIEHGCLPGEVEVAAYKIGMMVQKYGLQISFPGAAQEQQQHEDQQRPKYDPGWEDAWRREQAHRDKPRPGPTFAYGEVTVIGETEKALFLRDDENETEFWIPRSQCRNGCQHWGRGDNGVLVVSQWWADKEGWV